MNPSPRVFNGLIVLVLLAGCGGGGGGSSSSSSQSSDTGPGQAAISIAWPSRGRDVPLAANSVSLAILRGGKTLKTSLAVRPDDGSPSVVAFQGLPLGTLDVRLSAFASADGTGAVLSVGTLTFTPIQGAPTPVSVAMAPVVSGLALSVSNFSVPQNATTSLTVSALDAAGGAVSILPGSITWTSDAPTIATVAGTGSAATVTGIAVGSTTVRATLTRADGTTVSVAGLVTVSGTGGTVTVH